nr:DUF3489 domain-containing protein [Polymorphobacter sp.]
MTTDDTTTTTAAAVPNPTRTRRGKIADAVLPAATANAVGAPPSPLSPVKAAPKPTTKSDTVIKLLLRAKGATPAELIAATGWQPHSLRAFLSGLRKKSRSIVRETRKSGEGTYRIVAAGEGASVAATSDDDAGPAA